MPTHNEALLAYAACPPSARVFYTLEIWQSSFDAPARVVASVAEDMVFGGEAGAPRDGGAMVTFTACPFTADYPEQREGQPPTSKIKIDNVNRETRPEDPLGARRPRIHPDPVSRTSRHRSDRAGLWADRIRAARRAAGRHIAAQPAEQAVSAVKQKITIPAGFRACCREGSRLFPRSADWRAMGLAIPQLLGLRLPCGASCSAARLAAVAVPADLGFWNRSTGIRSARPGASCLTGLAAW
jgi:Domain of unknown function (DUF1833)